MEKKLRILNDLDDFYSTLWVCALLMVVSVGFAFVADPQKYILLRLDLWIKAALILVFSVYPVFTIVRIIKSATWLKKGFSPISLPYSRQLYPKRKRRSAVVIVKPIPERDGLSPRMLKLVEKTRQQPPETWPPGVPGLEVAKSLPPLSRPRLSLLTPSSYPHRLTLEQLSKGMSEWELQMFQGLVKLDLPTRVFLTLVRVLKDIEDDGNELFSERVNKTKAVYFLDGKALQFDEWATAILEGKITSDIICYSVRNFGKKSMDILLESLRQWKDSR